MTERKVAETRLIKSELRYRNLVDNINDNIIIIINTTAKIIYANPKFYDLLGYDDIENLVSNKYVLRKWRENRIKYRKRIANNEIVPNVFEYQAYHKNGSVMWLEDKVGVLIWDGAVSGMQIAVRNITENKNKEQDLKKLIEELTSKNNELIQFNYVVSHNLRAPIANIIGLSNLLRGGSRNLSYEDEIKQHIKSSATKIDEIIKDLNVVLNTKASLNVKGKKFFWM